MISVTPLLPAIALTARRGASKVISVPFPSGRRELSTKTGMPSRTAGCDRVRVQHLRAERRELRRLVEADPLDELRAVDDARIGGEHAVDVGPDLDRLRLQRGADQRRAVVAIRRGRASS